MEVMTLPGQEMERKYFGSWVCLALRIIFQPPYAHNLLLLGPYLHSLEISKLKQCSSQIEQDQNTFGISCVKNLVEYQRIDIEHSTDIARLKKEAKQVSHAASNNFGLVVFTNATLLTMESGNPGADLIRDGVLTIRAGVIEYVGSSFNYTLPTGATVIDTDGGNGTTVYIYIYIVF